MEGLCEGALRFVCFVFVAGATYGLHLIIFEGDGGDCVRLLCVLFVLLFLRGRLTGCIWLLFEGKGGIV